MLWCPAALERLDFYQRFAEHFDIETESGSANLGHWLPDADVPAAPSPDGAEIRP
jgi:hypothetical protein